MIFFTEVKKTFSSVLFVSLWLIENAFEHPIYPLYWNLRHGDGLGGSGVAGARRAYYWLGCKCVSTDVHLSGGTWH